MAATTLFAPQVRSVQPAFEYNIEEEKGTGTVIIYYTLSDFSEVSTLVNYKIIDPNIASGWGSDEIKKGKKISSTKVDGKERDYFFSIEFANDDKLLVLNQFYQIQIQLVIDTTNEETGEIETETSPWSQISLIRPIPKVEKIIIEELANENNTFLSAPESFTGRIEYSDNSVIEQISEVQIRIQEDSFEVYKKAFSKNFLGTEFRIETPNLFLKPGIYNVYLDYNTINGFKYRAELPTGILNIESGKESAAALEISSMKIKEDLDGGAIELSFSFSGEVVQQSGILKILRADAEHEFLNWKEMSSASVDNLLVNSIKWKDYSAEGGQIYRYKFIYSTNENSYLVDEYKNEYIEAIANYEDIFLSDLNCQLAIRYNPNISGFKWITQESVTNALGGRFPVIRANGDTYYRQFNLSGTLSFYAETQINNTSFDSRNRDMSEFFSDINHSLFFDIDTAFEYLKTEQYAAYKRNPEVIEKRFRDMAMSFLTNKSPKLFRSATEGNMIVYLTNISFTPNKQLSRNVYDFTATVTEICEATYENLKKYHLNIPKVFDKYIYVLEVDDIETQTKDGVIYLVPTISAGSILNGLPLLKEEKV